MNLIECFIIYDFFDALFDGTDVINLCCVSDWGSILSWISVI